jgi:hypothetical protein
LSGVLGEVAGAAGSFDGASLWWVIAAKNAKECGLASTIAPNESDFVACSNLEGCPIDDGLASNFYDEIADVEHRSSQPLFGMAPITPDVTFEQCGGKVLAVSCGTEEDCDRISLAANRFDLSQQLLIDPVDTDCFDIDAPATIRQCLGQVNSACSDELILEKNLLGVERCALCGSEWIPSTKFHHGGIGPEDGYRIGTHNPECAGGRAPGLRAFGSEVGLHIRLCDDIDT